ncbi:hypothetical protein B0H14DRAFT_2599268 [Mycena olivaceomarginata]|nr:hypothetical protein B0H14DRAFT_2599268 [Mycena olivaceomarginata]
MPPSIVTQNQLENVAICLTMTTNTLQIIADSMKTPFLSAIINTTQAVLKNVHTATKHKDDCVQLLEQIQKLLNAIMILHIDSDAGGEIPPEMLNHIGKFTEILHKVYTFVEAQQKGNRVKSFFHQGEMSTLLKDCQAGLQQSFDFFQIEGLRILPDITEILKDAEKRHQEVVDMIEKLSETTASERASTISGHYSWSSNRAQDFHGRESELLDILHLFNNGTPRIAILGAGVEHLALMTADTIWRRLTKFLSLTDNMPLAISLLAHLADTEGCSNNVLQWGLKQKQPVLSDSIMVITQSLILRLWIPKFWQHFKHFDDPDLECKFYIIKAQHYQEINADLIRTANICKQTILLAIRAGNGMRHSQALLILARIDIGLGNFSIARMYAYKSQKLARVSGYLYGEAVALRTEALCWKELGDHKRSLSLCAMAQGLLALCGMSDSDANLGILTTPG